MSRLGNVTAINDVKQVLNTLVEKGLISEWQLPLEGILTRLDAAAFFIKPAGEEPVAELWEALRSFPQVQYSANDNPALSSLPWRVTFSNVQAG